MKYFQSLLFTLIIIQLYGMEETSLFTHFTKSPKLVQETIEEHLYGDLIPFEHEEVLLVLKPFYDFVPSSSDVPRSYSTNNPILPFEQIANQEFIFHTSMSWGGNMYKTVIQFNPKPLVLGCPEPNNLFFDGPNVHNTCIIKAEYEGYDRFFTTTTPFENHKFQTFFNDEEEIETLPLIPPLQLNADNTPEIITAYALHKHSNRIALDHTNQNRTVSCISIIDDINNLSNASTHYVREHKHDPFHAFKHLAFLTRGTLIGVTHDHKLYILVKQNNAIEVHQQKIPIDIEDFAVNRTYPFQLIFTDTNNNIFYTNLSNINPQDPKVYYKKINHQTYPIEALFYDDEDIYLIPFDPKIETEYLSTTNFFQRNNNLINTFT